MKIMNCPLNGPRNISEFVWGGEVKAMPDRADASDRDWADYVFLENNTRRRRARVVVPCARPPSGSSPSATP